MPTYASVYVSIYTLCKRVIYSFPDIVTQVNATSRRVLRLPRNNLDNRATGSILGGLGLLTAVVTLMDMVSTPTGIGFIFSGHFLLNAFPAILIFAVFLALTGRTGISAATAIVSCGILYLFNGLKYIYWDSVIVPADLHLLLAPADFMRTVLAGLNSTTGPGIALLIMAAIFILSLAWIRGRRGKPLSRPFRTAVLCAAATASAGLYWGRGDATPILDRMGISQSIWKIELQLEYGLFNHLYLTSALNGFDPTMFGGDPELAIAYASSLDRHVVDDGGSLPDIVVLLAESFFDPATLRHGLLDDPLAPIRPGQAGYSASGFTGVHSAGGGTWMAEHSFVTGIPGPEFGPTGRWPFALSDNSSWTIAKALRRHGYGTVLIYPAEDNFIFDSRRVYLELGFDRYYDISDVKDSFGLADGTVDGQILNAVSRTLEEQEGPVFVFALSLDLHHPYLAASGPRRFLDEAIDAPELETYMRRQRDFAGRVASFLADQESGDAPLLFAMFGDHSPPLGKQLSSIGLKDVPGNPLYQTPYFIRSNYRPVGPGMPYLDLSYLAGFILDEAGLDGGEFFRVNAAIRDVCQGRFRDCQADADLIRSYFAYLGDSIAPSPYAGGGK